MANKNKVSSSLLEYTKTNLSYPGRKYIPNNIWAQAVEILEFKLSSDCCTNIHSRTNSPFLNTFISILKSMHPIYDRVKILETRSYILSRTSPECC